MGGKMKYLNTKRNGRSIAVHRVVAEDIVGRILRKDEVVHHKDGDRRNNDISNLQVMTHQEHVDLRHRIYTEKACLYCGRTFMPKSKTSKYCSIKCVHKNARPAADGGHDLRARRVER